MTAKVYKARRPELKRALQKSEERFRKVVESVPNALVMVSPKGLIEMVNAQTERMFGYSRNDLLGKPVEMLLPERYRPNHPGLRTEFFAKSCIAANGSRTRPLRAKKGWQRVSRRHRS